MTIYLYLVMNESEIISSTSIYDLVLLDVCHFHHHQVIVTQIWPLSRYSCLYLGSLHPRILKIEDVRTLQNHEHALVFSWCNTFLRKWRQMKEKQRLKRNFLSWLYALSMSYKVISSENLGLYFQLLFYMIYLENFYFLRNNVWMNVLFLISRKAYNKVRCNTFNGV